MDLGIEGRAAVVTGASRGIGLATAKALGSEGARVLLVARSEDTLSDAVEAVGAHAAGLPVDVTDQAAERGGVTREEALESARDKIPIGRFGTADEIAAVIAFLCSEQASDVLGSSWSVDGGAVPLFI